MQSFAGVEKIAKEVNRMQDGNDECGVNWRN